MDGCVILTYDLRVLGFGAKIGVSSEESERSPRRFKHIASNTVYQDDEFMRLIRRHTPPVGGEAVPSLRGRFGVHGLRRTES